MKIFLVVCLLLVACAQPQIEARPTSQSSFTEVQETNTKEIKVEETILEQTTTTKNSKVQNHTDDIDELKSILLKGIEGTQYHVTLDVTVEGNFNIKSTTDIYVQNQQSRVDTKADINGEQIETRVVILEEEMISCIYEHDWECETFPIDSEIIKLTTQQMREQLDNNSFTQGIKRIEDRKLAGVIAKCYMIRLPDLPTQEQCYSAQGAVLYQEFTIDEDHVVHTASAYSTSVANDVFVAPI